MFCSPLFPFLQALVVPPCTEVWEFITLMFLDDDNITVGLVTLSSCTPGPLCVCASPSPPTHCTNIAFSYNSRTDTFTSLSTLNMIYLTKTWIHFHFTGLRNNNVVGLVCLSFPLLHLCCGSTSNTSLLFLGESTGLTAAFMS